MKTLNKIKLALIISTIASHIHAAELQVNIDNIKSNDGALMAQIFLGEENYKNGVAQESKMVKAKSGAGQLTFANLEAGEYAVRMFHDENNNQKMDKNAFGMPTEGYGFSNEAVGNMGPPQYKDMVVTIKENDSTVETKAKMIY